MNKLGDKREDGYIFKNYVNHKNGSRYGAWASPESFAKQYGADFFERREARFIKRKAKEASRAQWHKHMDYLASLSADERAARDKMILETWQKEYRNKNEKRIKELNKQSYEKNKGSELFKERRREAARRHYNKVNAERIAKLDAVRKAKAAEKEAKRIVREGILAEVARKKAERELAKSLRPPRVVLTDEQRKERRRDEKRNYKHRRRAILRGQVAKATPKEIREAMVKAKGKCFYCGGKFSKLTVDHVVPIAKGGSHTLDNLVFACHACNSEKRDLPANEFGGKFGLLIV